MSDPSNPPEGLDPRFSLPSATSRSDKLPLVIGGVYTLVYGLGGLNVSTADNVAVVYPAHNRTRTC